jgi:hypothetical protein
VPEVVAERLMGGLYNMSRAEDALLEAWCSRTYTLVANGGGSGWKVSLPWGWEVVDEWHCDNISSNDHFVMAMAVRELCRDVLPGAGRTSSGRSSPLGRLLGARVAIEYSDRVDELSDLCVEKLREVQELLSLARQQRELIEVVTGLAPSWTGSVEELFEAVSAALT